MTNLDLRSIIEEKAPDFLTKAHPFFMDMIIKIVERIIRLDSINKFLRTHHQNGFEFIEELFDYLDFSYFVTSKDIKKIPAQGKLIIVANHPLGALDGLALLNIIGEIRQDVKIVANDVLMNIDNLHELFLPYNVFSHSMQKENIKKIEKALENEEAVIFFPAAEVSRMTYRGIRDKKWNKGAVRFAQKFNCPVLPIHINARNSLIFYFASLLHKGFSTLLLPRQIFRKKHGKIVIKIGDPISKDVFSKKVLNYHHQNKLLKKHVYKIGKDKKGIFETEKNIIHPCDARVIRNELENSELLKELPNGKKLFVVDYNNARNVLKEIARLRELTFRSVGEGTGEKKDFDVYDKYYKHIVLWDERELEIIGSYRLGLTKEILDKYGYRGLYNTAQFHFSRNFEPKLFKSVELGRSFIQKKYWRSKALDYLWQGIGAFLNMHPDVEYLFGAVSISGSYSTEAKEMIVYYYEKWHGEYRHYAMANNPFVISRNKRDEFDEQFTGSNHNEDFRNLKMMLKNTGFTVPVLLRKYSELTEYGGAKFLSFGIDYGFANSIDCMIVLDLKMVKNAQRERYYNQRSFVEKAKMIRN